MASHCAHNFSVKWISVRGAWFALILTALQIIIAPSSLRAADLTSTLAPSPPTAQPATNVSGSAARGGLTVDPTNREEAINFYNNYYHFPEDVALEWNGDFNACNAGETSQRFRNAVLQRINYFRAMAGVPADITFDAEFNRKAQAAAMVMSANDRLDHYPAPDWRCYSADAADAALRSNLYLDVVSPDAVDGYMRHSGDATDIVIHRRWLLYPQTVHMGLGDIPAQNGNPAANAIWVVDVDHFFDPRPATRDGFVAWPPKGFVPDHLIFDRWSLSYAGADFNQASVTLTMNGAAVPVTVLADNSNYGEPTIAWEPDMGVIASHLASTTEDTALSVRVADVQINGQMQNFEYTITTFTPPPYTPPTLVYAPFVVMGNGE